MSELSEAIHTGNLTAVSLLLDSSPHLLSPKIGFSEPTPPLLLAIQTNQLEVLRLMLDRGADPNMKLTFFDHLPIHIATQTDNVSALDILVSYGADFGAKSKRHPENHSALWCAAYWGAEKCVRRLLAYGADTEIYARDGASYQFTPLTLAIEREHFKLVEILLSAGAQLKLPDINGPSALYMAVSKGNLDLVKFLLDRRADPSDRGNHIFKAETALIKAVEQGNVQIVKTLLEAKADPNVCDVYNKSPLLYALNSDNIQIIKLLLDHGAYPDKADNQGNVPIDVAASKEHIDLELIEMLLSTKYECNFRNSKIALVALCNLEDERVTKLIAKLLDLGSDHNHMYNDTTALISAVRRGSNELVSLLLKHGADPLIKDCDDKNACDYAQEHGHTHLVELLRSTTFTETNGPEGVLVNKFLRAGQLAQGRRKAILRT